MVGKSRKRHQMRHLEVIYRFLRDQGVGRWSCRFART